MTTAGHQVNIRKGILYFENRICWFLINSIYADNSGSYIFAFFVGSLFQYHNTQNFAISIYCTDNPLY